MKMLEVWIKLKKAAMVNNAAAHVPIIDTHESNVAAKCERSPFRNGNNG